MRRVLTLCALVLTLLMGTLTTISAQQATPSAGGAGGAVTVYGSDGQPESTIEVTSIQDPFKDFDPSSPPPRGFHFVAADITVTAAKDAQINTYGFLAIDADGFVSQPAFVYRSSESQAATPDLTTNTLSAGDTASGLVYFQVLDGTAPAIIVYQPSYDRLVTVADLRDAPVEQGDAVPVLDNSGQPSAKVTVEDVTLPLTDFDPSSAPQRGFQFVGVTVTIENVGQSPLDINPSAFSIVDEQGFVSSTAYIYRTSDAEAANPSLQSNPLDPGKSVTGIVAFQMLAGTEPGIILYSPSGSLTEMQVRLAEYGAGKAPKPSKTPRANPPRPSPTDEGPVPGQETPTPGASTGQVTPGCEGVIDWATATVTNLTTWSGIISGDLSGISSGGKVDLATAQKAEQDISDLADNQAGLDTPDVAADAQRLVQSLFDDTDAALSDLVTATKANNTAGIAKAVADLTQIASRLNGDEFNNTLIALTTACPELNNVE